MRSQIVLAVGEGTTNKDVGALVGYSQPTARKWRTRFIESRLVGLHDEPRRGSPATITTEWVEDIIVTILEQTPENATRWSRANIGRIWQAFSLQPEREKGFKHSSDPLFVEKDYDIVGPYLELPVVLSVDELCEASHNSSIVASAHSSGSSKLSRRPVLCWTTGSRRFAQLISSNCRPLMSPDRNPSTNASRIAARSRSLDSEWLPASASVPAASPDPKTESRPCPCR